jgi:hypothetical protein
MPKKTKCNRRKYYAARFLSCFFVGILALRFVPPWICSRPAGRLWNSNPDTVREMAEGMKRWTGGSLTLDDLHTDLLTHFSLIVLLPVHVAVRLVGTWWDWKLQSVGKDQSSMFKVGRSMFKIRFHATPNSPRP